ncbi:MAG: GAF domain-containing protein [Planctomycetota bacterium]|nr:MAG: GAF domain-containing protein [Planctomycetota bacterium]REK27798.1 MAG: GAF domain-containing protein [Planctomycetota bacterium]REK34424.1 MAG: GAF domain-containing protein [Planctomycetota bacterium]
MAGVKNGEAQEKPVIDGPPENELALQPLSTANRQLTVRVDELELEHADLHSVVAATDIAVICLDAELRIRWLTPAIQRVVRLDSSDEGRPLADFAHDFVDADIVTVARQVLDSLAPAESVVHCHDDRTFLRRIAPYRDNDDHVGGVVITFVDITGQKQVENELIAAKELAEKTVDTVREPMLVLKPDLHVVSANDSFYKHFHVSPADTEGRLIYDLGNGQWDIPELRRLLGEILPENEVFNGIEVDHEFETIGRRVMLLNARRIDHIYRILLAIEDVTERIQAERKLQELTRTLASQVEQRTWAIRLMQDVAIIANEADSVNDAIRRALERVCSQLDWPVGHAFLPHRDDPRIFVSSGIWHLREPERFRQFVQASSKAQFRPGEGLIGKVVESRQLQWRPDVTVDQEFLRREEMEGCEIRAGVAFPILVRDETVGVLEFYACGVTEPDETLVDGMAQFGVQLGRVVERQRLREEIAEATAHEHRVIGQELHDTITQEIVGIGMLADQLRTHLEQQGSSEVQLAEEISTLLQQTSKHVRQISHNQMPVDVDPDRLHDVLKMLARNTEALRQVRCRVECPRPVTLTSGSTASHLYRIAQEAVQNALRHAEASEIVIRLIVETQLLLEIQDNGCGMTETQSGGMGQRIMRHRASLIGAELQIDTERRKGTTVQCRMPLRS